MGTHSSRHPRFAVLSATAVAILLATGGLADQPDTNMYQTPDPARIAEQYVKDFMDGQAFRPPSKGLIADGHIASQALAPLEQGLTEGSVHVRENIVELLVDVGTQCMQYKQQGVVAMDDREVVRVLAEKALVIVDGARERAMELLRKHCVDRALVHERSAIARAVATHPTREALLLVARAKAREAAPALLELSEDDAWRNETPLMIARAALGDPAILAMYDEEFMAAKESGDVQRFIRSLNALALIGTPETLRTVAEELRTPLIQEVDGSFERSVRLIVLEGLVYNYPEQRVLYPNYIIEEADFQEAEAFCSSTLRAVYDGPLPPFMTYRGHPEPVPGEK